MKPRDERRKVLIRARLKTGDGWHDACIVDLSRRGAGLQAARPPRSGEYVEIRRGLHVIIARVAWARGHRFGVSAQDEIAIDRIAADRTPPERGVHRAGRDRRQFPRTTVQRAERSRTLASRMQFGAAAIAGVAAAVIAGGEVRRALAAPLGEVATVLDR